MPIFAKGGIQIQLNKYTHTLAKPKTKCIQTKIPKEAIWMIRIPALQQSFSAVYFRCI